MFLGPNMLPVENVATLNFRENLIDKYPDYIGCIGKDFKPASEYR